MAQDGFEHLHAWTDGYGPGELGHMPVCSACRREVRQPVPHELDSDHATGPTESPRAPEDVPRWREDLSPCVLPTSYRTLMAVLTLPDAEPGLRASTVVALTGFEPVPQLVRTTQIKLRLLVSRGWALERAPGLFTSAPGPADLATR